MKYCLIVLIVLIVTSCSAQEPTDMTQVNLGSCESDVNLTPLYGDNSYGYDDNGTLMYCYCNLED